MIFRLSTNDSVASLSAAAELLLYSATVQALHLRATAAAALPMCRARRRHGVVRGITTSSDRAGLRFGSARGCRRRRRSARTVEARLAGFRQGRWFQLSTWVFYIQGLRRNF